MGTATLNINLRSRRMMTKSEAAHHCGRSIKQFDRECAIAPVVFPNGDLRWDVRDLDGWLDGLKAGEGPNSDDDIVGRLE